MNNEPNIPKKEDIQVPRDQPGKNTRSENIPPDGQRTADEFYADDQKPLLEGSELGDKLHSNRKRADGQLTSGSGGDSARPGKEGIFGKPIPPRGTL